MEKWLINLNGWELAGTILLLILMISLGRWLYLHGRNVKKQVQTNKAFIDISHEMLTPLTILSASVEHLKETLPEGIREYELMQINIERTVRLLQQLLEAGKTDDGHPQLLVSNVDVIKYITETVRYIEPLMVSKHIEFTMNCKPASMMGWTDTAKLDRIIFNLLSNAAKHTQPQGRVTLDVSTSRNFDRVIIRISDTGTGVQKLELSHTRELVFLHGGNIQWNTIEGQGTTYHVELPINKEAFKSSQIDESLKLNISDANTQITDLPPAYLHEGNKLTMQTADAQASHLLIVENNKELKTLMQQLLSARYHVVAVDNSEEAFDAIRSHEPDIIIADVMLPKTDGFELTRQIKHDEDYSHLPVILLTHKTQEEDPQSALSAGADDFITKPFKLKDLILHIDNLIANRQRIRRSMPTVEDFSESAGTNKHPSLDDEFLQRASKCVYDHIDDSDYDRETFAADMGASSSTLYNKLRALTGKNISSFIRDIRIKTACQLAKDNPDLRVSDIAYRVGFKDPKYFATSFKKVMGIQPKEYFEKLRG